MKFNGQVVNATVSKSGDTTTITFDPPGNLPFVSKNSVELTFTDTGTPPKTRTIPFSFTVESANPKALFVVGNAAPSLNAADAAVKARLESLGFEVVVVGALASQTSDADRKLLIVSSSTIPSGDVANKFQTVAVPVINWEQALQDNYLMTLDDGSVRGTQGGQTSVNIVKADHPLAAGLSGLVPVVNGTAEFSWGTPSDNATIVATIADDPSRAVIYVYEKGATLIDDTTKAPEKRILFIGTDNVFTAFNENGLKLFDAAVKYAVPDIKPPPQESRMSVAREGANITISWTGTGTLQSADSVTGPWADVGGATSPHLVQATATAKFYRIKQ